MNKLGNWLIMVLQYGPHSDIRRLYVLPSPCFFVGPRLRLYRTYCVT